MRDLEGKFVKVPKRIFICNFCGIKEFILPALSRRLKFCSRKCYYQYRSIYYRGKRHPGYKVQDIKSLSWLHYYLRINWGVPEKCEKCGKKGKVDLANKTGIYNKEKENWYWLCRRCHMKEDGRIK